MMFLPLIGLFLSSLMLWNAGPLYKYAAMIQVFVHGLALLGFLIRDIRSGAIRVLCLPFYFDMVNAASARAFFNLIARRSSDRWAPRVIRATKAM